MEEQRQGALLFLDCEDAKHSTEREVQRPIYKVLRRKPSDLDVW